MLFRNRSILVLLVLALGLTACKKWDDHVAVENQDLNQNLMDAIAGNSSLSKFRELLGKAGLESLLQSTKTHTVWAPTNDALLTLDPAISSDTAKLKKFLQNHISNQSYFTRNAQADTRIPMLNGKYIPFTGTKFDDATLVSADKYVSNGVLHVIDKIAPVLPSVWEYINSTTAQFAQNAFIGTGLNFTSFDASQAIIDSISAVTGLPVYQPGTGIVVRNSFNDRVYDLKREDKLYTYFVIADAGFVLEADSLKPYYNTTTTAARDSLTRWNTVKDLVVEGIYQANAIPANLVSKSGIPIPVNPSLITQSIKVSNGIVHVLSRLDFPTPSKFRNYQIEGENPSGFLSDKRSNTNYRVRLNPVTNTVFNDIYITGHGVTNYFAFYRVSEVPSMKYKVYGFAINDFQTGALTQSIVVKYNGTTPATTLISLPYAVPLASAVGAYNEVYLGEFTTTSFGTIELQLTSTTTGPIVLDYLRLVPQP
jgi:uncharacterized surface protein with fasciclin (FAS1) repeats